MGLGIEVIESNVYLLTLLNNAQSVFRFAILARAGEKAQFS